MGGDMTFSSAVLVCFRKYFIFSGRASRSEYWWFVLFSFLGAMVAGALDSLIFGAGEYVTGRAGPLGAAFSVLTLIPGISAAWRRMHDTGRSGFYLLCAIMVTGVAGVVISIFFGGVEMGTPTLALAGIVAIVGFLLILWWLTRPSVPGTNDYGPNPHEVTS